MTDIERLESLQTEIHRLEAILKPMYEERKELNRKINTDNKASLPFAFTGGIYFEGKSEKVYLYLNSRNKTYYTKPLYKANGFLYGNKTSRSYIMQKMNELKTDGYMEVN